MDVEQPNRGKPFMNYLPPVSRSATERKNEIKARARIPCAANDETCGFVRHGSKQSPCQIPVSASGNCRKRFDGKNLGDL